MPTYLNKIKLYLVAHKIISAIIILTVLGGGYYGYKKFTSTAGDTRYITAKVEKGNIVSTVTGSGQVSALNQIDIKPKTSGDIVYIAVQNGQTVGTGALIAELDTKDADKAVRDAEISLASAKLSLEKLKIQNSVENMSADLVKAYDDGFNTVSDAFSDLPTVTNVLENILAESNLSENAARDNGTTGQAYRAKAETSYYAANKAFETNQKNYSALSNTSAHLDIDNIIKETYETTKLLSDAIKNTVNFVNFMADNSSHTSDFTTYQSTLATYTNTINGHLSTLLAAETSIKNNQDSSENSSLDIQSAELTVQQKENALQDAKDNLADYFIGAPFAGTLTSLTIKKSDPVSASTIVATLITKQQIAEISVNEVDVAKIALGEKATLTFDAVSDLSLTGVVTEIDSIGTVSQGVVTYNVKISFDTQDARVKPSMTVNAAIITGIKQDVLVVSNGAVKSQNGMSYVEMFDTPLVQPTDGLIGSISKIAPNKIPVEVGLSNDRETEIISGIKEGDEIVTRTILPGSTTKATTAPTIFGAPGGGNRVRAN